MDEGTDKTHFNTLKEMILDEEKLVTYVSLSKEFCIHVNDSKSLMIKAVEDIRKNHSDTVLNINYVISGLAEDNKSFTNVCSESDITDYRKRLKIIFFEHIYSINKGNPNVDKVAYMAISKFDDYHLCSGLIKNDLCSKRTSDEIDSLKSKSQIVIDQKPIRPPPKKGKEEQVNNGLLNGNGDDKKVPEIITETKVKQEKISPKKEVINGNKSKQEVKHSNKPQKGIAGFFSRSESASSKKSTEEAKNKVSENKIKSEAEDADKKNEVENMEVDDDFDIKSKTSKLDNREERTAAISENKKKSNIKTKSKTNKSLTEIKKNAKVDKKRKRVLRVSDSESDDGKDDPFVNEDEDVHNQQIDVDSEDEIPPTPVVNTIKITSGILNPKKRRKIVTKTYTDEDGFILTRKEEVYESLSETEDTVDTKENVQIVAKKTEALPKEKSESIQSEVSLKEKKNGAKSSKKKISPPQKGKQSTLMSFFKKA